MTSDTVIPVLNMDLGMWTKICISTKKKNNKMQKKKKKWWWLTTMPVLHDKLIYYH